MATDAGGPLSGAYFRRAQGVLVGGVNSPVRSFSAVGGPPIAVDRAKGPWFWDLDGRRYIDYVCSWGPLLLGHAHPAVLKALRRTAARGTSFGACHPLEAEVAERVREAMPSCEKLRFVSSGTEATLSALRLARGATGRPLILKFDGCYHGHGDSLLVKAGSGAQTLGRPDSKGVPPEIARLTLTAAYNDLAAVEALFKDFGKDIAAVIVEPIAGNMGFVRAKPGFLQGLRRLCDRHGGVLIFDEVMTGFRVAWGGAQGLCNVRPDLTCLGKVIGGGLPAAAFGGRRELMDELAPLGGVYQAGTLSGNPLALAAGLATLEVASKAGFYQAMDERRSVLLEGWRRLFAQAGRPAVLDGEGGLFGLFFSAKPVFDLAGAKASDTAFFTRWFHAMLSEGVYLAPSPYEALFLSSAHSPRVLRASLRACERALQKLA
ncbi:MAG TPA: glutamate-1-semialdehyde 2,1-aminomutase [bacterium]|jgi:glutamate-1-semialdehyde 2,1-aminomutase|nr:glutamate-1-semialdehyde 2,1-aminomutase [bacterium]